MESQNLNNFPPENEDLDRQFRAHFSQPPLADDGFSQRVLAALPVSNESAFRSRRRFFCAAGLVAGLATAALGFFQPGEFAPNLTALDAILNYALEQLFTAPVGLALGLAALSLLAAFRGQWRGLSQL